MLYLPEGMLAKLISAQQTRYNNANPEARILAYHTPPRPESVATAWTFVGRIQGKSGIAVSCSEDYTFVYFWDTVNAPHYYNSHVSFYERATKTWSDFNGLVPPDNYTDNFWRRPLEIYGISPDDFWVAHSRAASHWANGVWTHHECAATGIAGRGDEVWVAIENVGVDHWDGSAWTHVTSDPGIHVGPVIAAPKKHVYSEASWNVGTLHHFDGSSWSVEAVPPGVLRAALNDGCCFFTCGSMYGGDLRVELYHPHSDTYSVVFTTGGLLGDIYALRWDDFYYANDGQLFHRWASGWSTEINLNNGTWPVMEGTNRDNIWAVHARGAGLQDLYRKGPADDDPEVYNLQYNSYWEEFASTPLGIGKTWTAITALGPKQIWICNTIGQIYYWNGLVWVLQHDLGFEDNHWVLESITAFGPKDVWAVGHRPDGPVGQHLILHYTVRGWTVSLVEDGPPLTWIWGSNKNDIWVIGEYGIQLHWNGSAWSVFRAQNAEAYDQHEHVRMAGCASDHIWAVGHGGRIFLWDGTAWSTTEYLADAGYDFDNVSVSSYWRPVISGTKGGAQFIPVVLKNTAYGESVWEEFPGLEGKVYAPANGIFSWRAGAAFVAAFGEQVLDSSKPALPIDVQFVEGSDDEGHPVAIYQFWCFPGTNIWAVGYSEFGTGVWKVRPPDTVSTDISDYLLDGSLSLSLTDPITALSASFENANEPLLKEINPQGSVLYLGTRLTLEFRIGDTEWMPLGAYYMDRAGFDVPGDISLDARNSVGKFLGDLPIPIDELYHTAPYNPHAWIEDILSGCGITSLVVCDDITGELMLATSGVGFSFPRDTMALDAINQILSARPSWRIVEKYDGTVIVGPPEDRLFNFNFPATGTYQFERGVDLFSRNVVIDDREAYSQVCVQTEAIQINGEEVMMGDGETSSAQLEKFPVVVNSETIYVDGVALKRDVHYTIDYDSGVIDFSDIPSDSGALHNRERCRFVAVFPDDPTAPHFPADNDPWPPHHPWRFRIDVSNDNFVHENVTLFDVDGSSGPYAYYMVAVGEDMQSKPPWNKFYQYWSLYIKGTNGGVPRVSQIQFFREYHDDWIMGQDEFQPTMTGYDTPSPNRVSSSCADASPSYNAFDGAAETYWEPEAGATEWWIKLDLGDVALGDEGALVTADYEASTAIYEDVPLAADFALLATKTLFVTVPKYTLPSDLHRIAKDIATQIGNAGRLETFVGPFRPDLLPGDSAFETVEGFLGSVATVTHSLGRSGFFTEFTVDSGGRVGSPSLKDLLDRVVERMKVEAAIRLYTEEQKNIEPI